jgi:hypothetical protein
MIKLLVLLFALYALGASQVSLKPGKAYSASTSFNSWSYYYIPASESTANYIQLISNVTNGVPFYYFNIDSLPTFQNNTWRYENANGGNAVKYFYNPNYNQITGKILIGRLYLGVYGYSNTRYTITLNNRGPIELYDRKAMLVDFPIPKDPTPFVFYSFNSDIGLRMAQIVSRTYTPQIPNSYNQMFLTNTTSFFPNNYNCYNFAPYSCRDSILNPFDSFNYTSCFKLNYPWPGRYYITVRASYTNYTIQLVKNGLGSCYLEN